MVVVLHEVGALAPLIDRAVVLRDGRVAHDGPLGALGQAGHRLRDTSTTPDVGRPGWLDGAVER